MTPGSWAVGAGPVAKTEEPAKPPKDCVEHAKHLALLWRIKYPARSLMLMYGPKGADQTELTKVAQASTPLLGKDCVGVYEAMAEQSGPTFSSPQRVYARVDSLPDDVAECAVREGWVGDGSDEAVRAAGAWRWPLVSKHRARILPLLTGRVLDFGGLAGPVGYGADIVDHGADARAIYDVEGEYDTIFTSHTLEHVKDLDLCLFCLNAKLKPGGHIIAHVPSSYDERLRAGNWPLHHQTFCLSDDIAEDGWVKLDERLSEWGEVVLMDDDRRSLLVIARKEP